jgi:hypothetical protein
MTEINNNTYLKSNLFTIGVDEVGRGTLFGNVVAAAVIMPDDLDDELFSQIKDSKKLSFKNIPAPANLRKTIRVVEYSNRVTLSNAKASEQNIIYRESIPGEGKIQQSNREYSLLGKGNVEWKLTIPAKGKVSLDYTVRANLRN